MTERLQLNLRLDGHKDLLLAVKDAATKQGLSVNQFVIAALRQALSNEGQDSTHKLDSSLELAIAHSVEKAIALKLDSLSKNHSRLPPLDNDRTNQQPENNAANPTLDTPLDTPTTLDTPLDKIEDRYVIGLLDQNGREIKVLGYWYNTKKGFLPDQEKAKIYIGETNAKRAVTLIEKKIQLGNNQQISCKRLNRLK